MVKNQFGGNKQKSQARKNINTKPSLKLRLSECDYEVYCVVTKMNGNGMFNALGIDNVQRLGFIRGKFTGRGRRDNIVEVGKWVLLGDREWASVLKKEIPKSDLLEVYNDIEKDKLQKIDSLSDWSILLSNDNSFTKNKNEEDAVIFSNETPVVYNIDDEQQIQIITFSPEEFISEDFGAFNINDI
jgi:translation initiation factor IF-1